MLYDGRMFSDACWQALEEQKWVKWVLALAKQIRAYRIRQDGSSVFDAFTWRNSTQLIATQKTRLFTLFVIELGHRISY